jgi:outer membrane immunogenic protein
MKYAIAGAILLAASGALAQEMGGVWQGPYVGVHGGYATGNWWGEQSYTANSPAIEAIFGKFDGSTHGIASRGALAGGQTGYLWQSGPMVWGVEIDASWMDLRGNGVLVPYPHDPAHGTAFGTPDWGFAIQQSWQTSTRIRMGYAPGFGALFYGTAGPVLGGFHEEHSVLGYGAAWTAATLTSHTDKARLGWVVGGGVEWAIAPKLTLRTEYLYESFPGVGGLMTGWPTAVYGPPTDGFKGPVDYHVVRAGLNYSF